MAREYFQSRVLEVRPLCGNVKHVVFERADGKPTPYAPGQFMQVHFQGQEGVEIYRSYSIAAPPRETHDQFALCVKLVEGGQGSTLIHSLKEGDEVKTSGAHGRFTLRGEKPEDLILVATGTGIAPFRSMYEQLRAMLDERRVWVLMGVRHTDELLYHDDFLALAEHPNMRYRTTVSRPDASWTGAKGYVGQFMDEIRGTTNPATSLVYLCGVPQMVDEIRTSFQSLGLPIRAIRSEKFVSPPKPGTKAAATEEE
jgi:ferredoxin-NADP reductase